ncbi:MAG: hypothetical protein FWG46_08825 [Treponema sp.]|nr:hypothetical protein [Treponema sp.]
MKKYVFAAVLAVLLTAGVFVFAQNIPDDHASEYYYINISLEKVWPYRKGYVVQYRKGLYQTARAYIPSEWFTNTASRGEIITLPPGNAWPSMTVYYKEGEFSHVRLYVHRWQDHQTWGNVPQNINIDSYFEGVETIDLQFR